ncbi:hypothetical protein [Vogesella alkaliphila]|uniref:Integrase n=1 Tax=Vogesella alkaliphila TaxID=1193621 RepID=A0ABQ2YLE1_9NEIS|nr:hypothetical protein [Vogesella alkaliphila]GGX85511.1 hypothetical protein GCM10011290_11450 [Vogesella alkaliphila]
MDSLSTERAKHVLALINHISDDLKHSGRRTETVRDYATRFLVFMYWADTNGFYDVLSSAETARPVVQAYIRHLRERVLTNSISINGAARQQSTVITFLERFLQVDNLTHGINLLRKNPAAREATTPPSQNSQARILTLCEMMFDGLASFILEKKSYPHALAVPDYLDYPDNSLWIFPTTVWFVPRKKLLDEDIKWSRGYNYSEGRVVTVQELLAAKGFTGNKQAAQNIINCSKRQLHRANVDKNHTQRQRLGLIALNVFILLFLAQTGMNWAQIVTLPWANEYDISATHQIFRTIKCRAGSKAIAFELPVSFMPRFKRYLELRNFVLSGQSCAWLFFTLGINGKGLPAELKISGPYNIYQTLQRIDPDLPVVMPRQWRAAKSDWLIRNTDPSTTALVLQNTEKTVLSHYAAGSETSHIEELTGFLDRVSETVIDKGQVIEGGIDRAVGYCSSYGTPNSAKGAPIQPDCKGPEGCFFCDKYRVHADEKDTRKLISCRYCLQLTMLFAGSDEFIQTRLDPIFKKIEKTLSEISLHDKDLVLRVTKEVEEDGELDQYWARKLEMLMELGLAS